MCIRSFWVVLVLLLGGGIWWLQAAPPPAPAAMPATTSVGGPTITWSVLPLAAPGTNPSQITVLREVLFPGTSSTTVVTFRSHQDLAGVVVEATPSLAGVVSISPTGFPSITANQEYQITFTLRAPPEFKERALRGAIHVRNAGDTSGTYAKPLQVDLRTGWKTVSDAVAMYSIALPPEVAVESGGTQTSLRAQNFTTPLDAVDTMGPGDYFVEISSMPLADNPAFLFSIDNPESLLVGGYEAFRGVRRDASISPLPGYDMYVPVGPTLYVVAGTYDGASEATLTYIRSIQLTFKPL